MTLENKDDLQYGTMIGPNTQIRKPRVPNSGATCTVGYAEHGIVCDNLLGVLGHSPLG